VPQERILGKIAGDTYADLMQVIRRRLDLINMLQNIQGDEFSRAESAAFHGRKTIEGIAFACLVATENGIKHVPRDAKGQWNAETILKNLKKKKIVTLPSPSIVRQATQQERSDNGGVEIVIEGIPARRLSHDELIEIYQRTHRWLHEINPYTEPDYSSFCEKNARSLWHDLARVNQFIEKHFISIGGQGFFCVLRDNQDGLTKVQALSRPPGWSPGA
jgi:hypothetical protein